MKKMLMTMVMLATAASTAWAQTARVKDFVEVDGARTNKIIGEGLVTGLAGTGDSPKSITVDILRNFLQNHAGFAVNSAQLTTKSVALVTVEAELPPFQASGTTIDVRVSVIGDAKSLSGGTLLLTPLRSPRVKAEDPTVFALASGPLVLDGAAAVTTASIPSGGRIETAFQHNNGFVKEEEDGAKSILLHLNRTDFTTANAVADAINKSGDLFGMTFEDAVAFDLAKAVDGGTIRVKIPLKNEGNDFSSNPVKFVSTVLDVNIALVSVDRARVIINDKTKVIAVTGEVLVKRGQAAKAGMKLKIDDDKLLIDVLNNDAVKMAHTPQDLIDLVKELNNLGLIKGEVISR